MANRFTKFITLIADLKSTRQLLVLRFNGFLPNKGWFKSAIELTPVNKDGNPIPWATYSFISFIEPRLSKKMEILEFGSGSSTLYYSSRVKSLFTVEQDEEWYKKLRRKIPGNVVLHHVALDISGDYAKTAVRSAHKFDMIIVDGGDRVNCIKFSYPQLKDSGVVILDDSERNDYLNGAEFLKTNGFRRIDFWGMSPGRAEEKCTTVFYRPDNCLNI